MRQRKGDLTKPAPYRPRDWYDRFLAVYETCGMVRLASRFAGIHWDTYYEALERDPVFAARAADAKSKCIEQLHAIAQRLALEGNPTMVKYLLGLLSPDEYGITRRVRLEGRAGGPVEVTMVLSDRPPKA